MRYLFFYDKAANLVGIRGITKNIYLKLISFFMIEQSVLLAVYIIIKNIFLIYFTIHFGCAILEQTIFRSI